MGRDAYVYIPQGNSRVTVRNQLELLGYKKYRRHFYCGNGKDYKHFDGVSAWFVESHVAGFSSVLRVRTQASANSYDVYI